MQYCTFFQMKSNPLLYGVIWQLNCSVVVRNNSSAASLCIGQGMSIWPRGCFEWKDIVHGESSKQMRWSCWICNWDNYLEYEYCVCEGGASVCVLVPIFMYLCGYRNIWADSLVAVWDQLNSVMMLLRRPGFYSWKCQSVYVILEKERQLRWILGRSKARCPHHHHPVGTRLLCKFMG